MPETLLLTGGTGYLGRHLVARFLDAGHHVCLLVRSSTDLGVLGPCAQAVEPVTSSDLPSAVRRGMFAIVHCATHYGRGLTEHAPVVEANLLLPLRLLDLAVERGVHCFLNVDTALEARVNPYALAKKQLVAWLHRRAADLVCANLVVEQFYGPNDPRPLLPAHVVRTLVAHAPELPLTPGEQRRDFLFVDDVVEAIALVLSQAAQAERGFTNYDVGTGRTCTVRHFVELAKRVSGNTNTTLRFGALSYRPEEVMETRLDPSTLRALGWAPSVSLEEGLIRTFAAAREARCGS